MRTTKLPIRLLCAIFSAVLIFSVFSTGLSVNVSAGTVTMSGQTGPDYGEKTIVVSLGDSYSSGEGNNNFYGFDAGNMSQTVQNEDWLAHRSEHAWSGQLRVSGVNGELKDHRYVKGEFVYTKSDNWYFAASSGAVTDHINKSDAANSKQPKEFYQWDGPFTLYHDTAYLPGQLDIFYNTLGEDRYEVDYVTITIGGNDVGFSEIVGLAVTAKSSELFDRIDKELNTFYYKDGTHDKIKNAYKRIEEAAPNATIIVAGYPELFSYSGALLGLVSRSDADYINKAINEFNKRINLIVEECRNEGMKIEFVSVEERFKGRQAYSQDKADDEYINRIMMYPQSQDLCRPRVKADWDILKGIKNSIMTLLSAYSMHPNKNGQKQYAEAVQAKIDELEGKATKQTGFTRETSDVRNVVLVLDNSGSMEGTPLSETKKAASKFIDTVLAEGAGIGIVSFSTYANIESDFSKDADYLKNVVNGINTENMTNTYAGLALAENLLDSTTSSKKIIVLMSDGLANEGITGNALINYANTLKEKGIIIYTLGFFSSLGYYDKVEGQNLMQGIASEGNHYEVDNAENLIFFFNDIGDQINGQNYVYVKLECPIDVTVTSNGETLSSVSNQTHTSFGSLTFEEGSGYYGWSYSDTRTKILRLREDREYTIYIRGNGEGTMNVKVGFMDSDGNYTTTREIEDVPITRNTYAEMNATRSEQTVLKLDSDGDGKFEKVYREGTPERGAVIWPWIVFPSAAVVIAAVILIIVRKRKNGGKSAPATAKTPRVRRTKASFCKHCGSPITGKCKFCTSCGKDLTE